MVLSIGIETRGGVKDDAGIVTHRNRSICETAKGELKLENEGEYERRVESVVEQCDAQIAQFEAAMEEAGPEQKAKYDEEMSVLIANREAVRRGLVRPGPEGELCSSCPEGEAAGETVKGSIEGTGS